MLTKALALLLIFAASAPAYQLLLLDDGPPDYGMPDDYLNLDRVEDILDGMGIAYDHVHNNRFLNKTSSNQFLENYDIILWYNDNRAITPSEFGALRLWVGQGNFLVVTGEDSLGSPNDPLMAELVGSLTYGDYPFTERFTINNSDSWIADGEAGFYSGTYDILPYASDHDLALPKPPGTYAVAYVPTEDNAVGTAKILVTELVPPKGGIIVYWNGNRDAAEWWRMTQTPHTVNMFKNMMLYLTQRVMGVEEMSWGGLKSVFAQ